jgi:hypothetical protein
MKVFVESIAMSAPYRIVKRSTITAQADVPDAKARDYTDRLIRLMPAEVAGIYTGVRGIWLPNDYSKADLLQLAVLKYWLPIGGLLLVVALRVWGSRRPGHGYADVQWWALAISAAAFLLWVAAMGDPLFGFTIDQRVPASLLIAFGALAPAFYQGTSQ